MSATTTQLLSSFANCVMTLYLLQVHLQTFLCIPRTQKCQILCCDTLVANERYVQINFTPHRKHRVYYEDLYINAVAICRESLSKPYSDFFYDAATQSGHGLLILAVYRSHTTTYHSR
jgi:hypothetical protein